MVNYTNIPACQTAIRMHPRLFTKLLKVPLSKIRKELKATIAAYLDDSIGIERGEKEELKDS